MLFIILYFNVIKLFNGIIWEGYKNGRGISFCDGDFMNFIDWLNIFYTTIIYVHTVAGYIQVGSVWLIGTFHDMTTNMYISGTNLLIYQTNSNSIKLFSIFLPLISIPIHVAGHLFTNRAFLKYTNIKNKYSFLKSRRIMPKSKTFLYLPKIFTLCTLCLHYDSSIKISVFSQMESCNNKEFLL